MVTHPIRSNLFHSSLDGERGGGEGEGEGDEDERSIFAFRIDLLTLLSLSLLQRYPVSLVTSTRPLFAFVQLCSIPQFVPTHDERGADGERTDERTEERSGEAHAKLQSPLHRCATADFEVPLRSLSLS